MKTDLKPMTDYLVGLGIFQQIPVGTHFHEVLNKMVVIVHGENQNLQIRILFPECLGGLNTVHLWHFQIQQNYIQLSVL